MEWRAKDPKETAETDQRSSMALSESETRNFTLSLSSQSFTSDSEEDPTFDFLEESCSSFSRLSIKKTFKSRVAKEKDEDAEGKPYVQEPFVPGLDEKDQKSYDIIEKVIKAGQAQKLKANQCKIYLRKHGLRLTGTKDILIKRIQEYLEILNGEGEKKYPPSSFVVNCKGDACERDVILFEQNVYEMFNITSRCGNGPPRGTRVIAGRIVKESYGAAKQQHTFTIEVLWSKGEKPLPPLHPLLIKGRNLYRLKTMRQKWEDEGERQRILIEKHARGCVARSKREMRIQQREMRKMLKSNRVLEATELSRNEEETRKQKLNSVSITSKNMPNQPQPQAENMHHVCQAQWLPTASHSNFDRLHVQRQLLTGLNSNLFMVPSGVSTHGQYFKLKHSMSSGHPASNNEEPENHYSLGSKNNVPERDAHQESMNLRAAKSSFQGHNQSSVQRNYSHRNKSFNPSGNARQVQAHVGLKNLNAAEVLVPDLRPQNSRLCRYYVQGRCYYGQNCRYLHQC